MGTCIMNKKYITHINFRQHSVYCKLVAIANKICAWGASRCRCNALTCPIIELYLIGTMLFSYGIHLSCNYKIGFVYKRNIVAKLLHTLHIVG